MSSQSIVEPIEMQTLVSTSHVLQVVDVPGQGKMHTEYVPERGALVPRGAEIRELLAAPVSREPGPVPEMGTAQVLMAFLLAKGVPEHIATNLSLVLPGAKGEDLTATAAALSALAKQFAGVELPMVFAETPLPKLDAESALRVLYAQKRGPVVYVLASRIVPWIREQIGVRTQNVESFLRLSAVGIGEIHVTPYRQWDENKFAEIVQFVQQLNPYVVVIPPIVESLSIVAGYYGAYRFDPVHGYVAENETAIVARMAGEPSALTSAKKLLPEIADYLSAFASAMPARTPVELSSMPALMVACVILRSSGLLPHVIKHFDKLQKKTPSLVLKLIQQGEFQVKPYGDVVSDVMKHVTKSQCVDHVLGDHAIAGDYGLEHARAAELAYIVQHSGAVDLRDSTIVIGGQNTKKVLKDKFEVKTSQNYALSTSEFGVSLRSTASNVNCLIVDRGEAVGYSSSPMQTEHLEKQSLRLAGVLEYLVGCEYLPAKIAVCGPVTMWNEVPHWLIVLSSMYKVRVVRPNLFTQPIFWAIGERRQKKTDRKSVV